MTDKQQDTKNKVKKGYLKIHVTRKYKDQRDSYSLDVTDEKVYDGRKVMEQLVEQVL